MSTESLETRVAALEAANTEVIVRLDALDRTTKILTQDVASLRNQGVEHSQALNSNLRILAAHTIRLTSIEDKVDGIEAKVGGIEAKVGGIEAKVGGIEAKVGGIEAKVGGLEKKVDAGFEELRGRVDGLSAGFRDLQTKMDAGFDELRKAIVTLAARLPPPSA